MSGKGDTPRPLSVDPETYAERYDRTFGQRNPDGTVTIREQNDAGGTTLSRFDPVSGLYVGHGHPTDPSLPTTDTED